MTRKGVFPAVLLTMILISSCSSPSYILVSDRYFAETEASSLERKLQGGVKTVVLEEQDVDPLQILELIGPLSKKQMLLFSPLLNAAGAELHKVHPDLKIFYPAFEQDSTEVAAAAADAVFEAVRKTFPEGEDKVTMFYTEEPYSKVLLAEALQERFQDQMVESRVIADKSSRTEVKTPVLLVFCGDRSSEIIESAAGKGEDIFVISDRRNRGKDPGNLRILQLDWVAVYKDAVSLKDVQPEWRVVQMK